jgi:hypothetical protein
MVERLSRVTYPSTWNLRRQPARPQDLWVFDFEKNYDWDTIWNDAIQINLETVLLIGPPLYHHGSWILDSGFLRMPDGSKVVGARIEELDRVCRVVIPVTNPVPFLQLSDGDRTLSIKVNQPSFEFAGTRTIVTISRDHPISWLKQWIDYHRMVHDINGLLLYNNQSQDYTSEELEFAISRDDMIIKVVDYDVPFGCMGGGDWEWQGRKGTHLPWDSDFAQYSMLEHAKWRYLHCADLVINADTDELLYTKNMSIKELSEYCKHSSNSVWLYRGTWIEPVSSVDGQIAADVPFCQRKFSNYWHTANSNQRGIGIKWLLNPQRNLQYQWHLHRTFGPHMLTEEIGFGHYMAMNTSWSWKRDSHDGNVSKFEKHVEIKQHLDRWHHQKRIDK